MIGLEDRQTLARDIEIAHSAGARLRLACEVAGIDERTLQRWKARQGLTAGDARLAGVKPSYSRPRLGGWLRALVQPCISLHESLFSPDNRH